MLEFKKVTFEDLPVLNEFFKAEGSFVCEHTMGVLYMWGDRLNYEYCFNEGLLYLRTDRKGERIFYMPIGKGDKSKSLPKIAACAKEQNMHLTFFAASAEQLDMLRKEFPDMQVKEGHGDYIYAASDLINLPGKKYHSKKNHINRFKRENPSYGFYDIDEKAIPRLQAFLEGFYMTREKLQPLFYAEKRYVENVLANYFKLDLLGAYLEVDGKVAGFAIGEKRNNILFVHIEKAYVEINGAYAMLNREFAARFASDVEYINREDDAGDEGLRKAKLSYNPVMMAPKYLVKIF